MTTNRLPLSVIFLTFNSEAYIEASLRSVVDWVDELFVVDSGSTDKTLDIVKKYAHCILCHPFDNYSKQRNWAQNNLPITNEWIFHLDADERVTSELCDALQDFFSSGQSVHVNGLLVARRVVFLNKWIRHGGMYPVYHCRIFKRDKGRCEERLYDQHFVVQGATQKIRGDLIDLVAPDLESWMKSHLRWAALEVSEQLSSESAGKAQGVISPRFAGNAIERRRWAKARVYSRIPLFARSIGYFFYRYFLCLGFLDGVEGLIYHTLQGFWFRFYVDAKLWETRKRTRG